MTVNRGPATTVTGAVTAAGAGGSHGWRTRIEAATPPHRDRTIDAARAVAIAGVVFGHWLVTALVADPEHPVELRQETPLAYTPGLAPLTWLLQTLGLFFFAGGYAAARSLGSQNLLPWLGARLRRLGRPVLALAAIWLPTLALLAVVGTPASTFHVAYTLVYQPLWYLAVYVALSALTPVLRTAVARAGVWPALPFALIVAATDAVRPYGLPAWLPFLVTPVAWAVPYVLGIALAEDRLPPRIGAALLLTGVGGGTALVLVAGYPAGAVGLPGSEWSNLNPPSLFALALSAAQVGVFLLLRPWLGRLLRRPAIWAPVAGLNLTALTVFCWHQPALLVVTFTGLVAGPLPGLLDEPSGTWPAFRLLWLPLFALVLAALSGVFHHHETAGRSRQAIPPTGPGGQW